MKAFVIFAGRLISLRFSEALTDSLSLLKCPSIGRNQCRFILQQMMNSEAHETDAVSRDASPNTQYIANTLTVEGHLGDAY